MSTPPVNPNPFAAPVVSPPVVSKAPAGAAAAIVGGTSVGGAAAGSSSVGGTSIGGASVAASANPYAAPRAVVEDQTDGAAPLAERSDRLSASIVDVLIYGVAWAPALLYPKIGGFILAGVLFLGILIWNCMLLANHGQTVGKKVKNIRIVRTDGTDAGFVRAFFYRAVPAWVLGAIPAVGPLLGLVNVLFIFRDDRRCVHDMIADTKVIAISKTARSIL